jgi:Bacterial regulatory helix-turn-helix protein, lysR family
MGSSDFFHVPAAPRQYRNSAPYLAPYGERARLRRINRPKSSLVVTRIVDGEYPMEFHQVRYFLAVASTLNFTRAAEMCNVTQPALTKGVQKLEDELGGQLIYRERQLTHLTDLGKAAADA